MSTPASKHRGGALALALCAAVCAACGSRSDLEQAGSAPTTGGAGGAAATSTGGAATTATGGTNVTIGGAGGAGTAECKPGDAPVLLATNAAPSSALALDDAFVYFAPSYSADCVTDVDIRRVSKAGGPADKLVLAVWPLSAIAVDDSRVYWVDDPISPCTQPADPGYLLHAGPKEGGPPTVFPPGGGLYPAVSMAMDSTHVYWADNAPSTQSIFRASKDGGAPDLLYSTDAQPTNIAADEGHVYTSGTFGVFAIDTATKVGTPMLDQPGPGGFIGIAADADNVYFGGWLPCDGPDCGIIGTIEFASKADPGVPTQLSNDFGRQPLALAEIGPHLYWSDIETGDLAQPPYGRIMRIGKDGSDKTKIADANLPIRIAVDDTCVYWTDEADGSIWKAPR